MKLQFKEQDVQLQAVKAVVDCFEGNIKPYRTADDVLAQVMLDWGLPLSLKIESAMVADKQLSPETEMKVI